MSAPDRGRWLAPLLVCHECGLAQIQRALPAPGLVLCARCRAVLRRVVPGSVTRAVHLYLAALVLFVTANLHPFLAFGLEGRGQVVVLASGVARLWREGMPLLACIVLGASLLFPAAKMLATLWALGPLLMRLRLPGQVFALRLADELRAWAMLDVFLLAVIVAWVKLADLATLEPGPGLWAFLAALLLATAADATLDHHDVWERFGPQATLARIDPRAGRPVGCRACGQVTVLRRGRKRASCPRCGGPVHLPDREAIARAWAFLLAALAFYLPANLLPVMTVTSLGRAEPTTILGGVVLLIRLHMYPVAAVVFTASVLVPIFKFLALGLLLVTGRRGIPWRRQERTLLYRAVEFVGRWSMVDVFVVALLVALVDMGALATIEAGAGITAFASTVILTMLASASFDPRLIWQERPPIGQERIPAGQAGR
jgi:paraquat-inducible protein A